MLHRCALTSGTVLPSLTHNITDVRTIIPVGGIWTFWVRQERSSRELASALPAALGTATEAWGAVGRAVHLLPRSRASIKKRVNNNLRTYTMYSCGYR